jgi:hypothetical protein
MMNVQMPNAQYAEPLARKGFRLLLSRFMVPGFWFRFSLSRLPATGYRLQLFVMPQLRGDIDQLGSAATDPKRSRRAGTALDHAGLSIAGVRQEYPSPRN